jgi:HlyD family secretion protein
MRPIVSATITAITLVLFAGAVRSADTPPPDAQVIVVRATNACFSASVRVTGFLVARSEAVVNLSQGDRLVEAVANEGDKVSADQTLARVERQSLDPTKPGATKTDMVALKAPAAGVVTARNMPGSTMIPQPPRPLFVIAMDGEIELEAEVPSIHVGELATGQTARIQIRNMRELSGRVRLVPAAIDQRTQLGRARISVESDPSLRFGMFAQATIDADRSCGISIPNSAVTYRTGGTSVQVVRDSIIETRRIEVGIHTDSDTEVRNGLNEGDLVVANAGTSLRDGDKVKPIDSELR